VAVNVKNFFLLCKPLLKKINVAYLRNKNSRQFEYRGKIIYHLQIIIKFIETANFIIDKVVGINYGRYPKK